MAAVKDTQELEDMLALSEACPDMPGMTYNQGVIAALLWALGHTDEAPYSEDDKED